MSHQAWAVYQRDGQYWSVVRVYMVREQAENWVLSRQYTHNYSIEPTQVYP